MKYTQFIRMLLFFMILYFGGIGYEVDAKQKDPIYDRLLEVPMHQECPQKTPSPEEKHTQKKEDTSYTKPAYRPDTSRHLL
ncbi:hypothetical protein ACLBXI_28260 [Bacillus cereus]